MLIRWEDDEYVTQLDKNRSSTHLSISHIEKNTWNSASSLLCPLTPNRDWTAEPMCSAAFMFSRLLSNLPLFSQRLTSRLSLQMMQTFSRARSSKHCGSLNWACTYDAVRCHSLTFASKPRKAHDVKLSLFKSFGHRIK